LQLSLGRFTRGFYFLFFLNKEKKEKKEEEDRLVDSSEQCSN